MNKVNNYQLFQCNIFLDHKIQKKNKERIGTKLPHCIECKEPANSLADYKMCRYCSKKLKPWRK